MASVEYLAAQSMLYSSPAQSFFFFVITSISFGVVINSSCTTRAKLNLLFKGVVPHRAQRMFQSGHACTLTRRYRNVLCFKGAQNKP